MSKHTPGPWYRGEEHGDTRPTIWGKGQVVVCEMNSHIADAERNESLVLAAPDLLAAIKPLADACAAIMRDEYNRDPETSGEWMAAVKAIAKAEGR
jgi:hypothetical protein